MGVDIRKEGAISEWNEGTLFSLRMHEAKELINYGKMYPLSPSPDGKGWGYQSWISGIEILYGEGNSKYSTVEIDEVNKVKQLVSLRVKFRAPHRIVSNSKREATKTSVLIDKKNWEGLKKLIEMFEQKVKFYNDKRGMGTRNQTTEGLF